MVDIGAQVSGRVPRQGLQRRPGRLVSRRTGCLDEPGVSMNRRHCREFAPSYDELSKWFLILPSFRGLATGAQKSYQTPAS